MTSKETAANISKTVTALAEDIATRSVPDETEHFSEWSSDALHRRIKANACNVLLDFMLSAIEVQS